MGSVGSWYDGKIGQMGAKLQYFGHTLGTLRAHSEHILSTLKDHSEHSHTEIAQRSPRSLDVTRWMFNTYTQFSQYYFTKDIGGQIA